MASLRAARGIATLQNIAKIATWQTLLNCKNQIQYNKFRFLGQYEKYQSVSLSTMAQALQKVLKGKIKNTLQYTVCYTILSVLHHAIL